LPELNLLASLVGVLVLLYSMKIVFFMSLILETIHYTHEFASVREGKATPGYLQARI
jgi:hypothetical protein